MLKLNIGAGAVEIEGFEPVDRRFGKEAYPLPYEDESVDEIRASHILEHFGHREVPDVLRDWCRVLKPGGKIRIAVPDFDKITTEFRDDPRFEGYIFGGQTDENDFHKSLWTKSRLESAMVNAGITGVKPWTSSNTDCASLPVSLNLEGVKDSSETDAVQVKIAGIMTMGRCVLSAPRNILERAVGVHGIPVETSNGVYYGQCIQRMMEKLVDTVDIILALDTDTLCTPKHVADLIYTLASRNDIDCLAALQVRRGGDRPLLTTGENSVSTDGTPFKVATAHFGLTVIRTEALRTVEKPWLYGEPDEHGGWGEGRLDPDIWFWHQWRKAGYNIYVDPKVNIGHQEECVSFYDENLKVQRVTVPEWRKLFLEG